jgi:hypothetical protein
MNRTWAWISSMIVGLCLVGLIAMYRSPGR